jgi:hypothetical protein
MYMQFGWCYYYMWLTWNYSCDLWTLGGSTYFSLQDLTRWTCIYEEMTCSNLHGDLEPKDGCKDPTYGEGW